MSTKTSFKRIALVAVSALGFGLLSVMPAKAAEATPTSMVVGKTTEDDGVALAASKYTASTILNANGISEFSVQAGSSVELAVIPVGGASAAATAAADAALEAIDAANAATDAANLAAEAADAATVAAEEARDAADSATAAVEALASEVATLMAALKAQITTLAKTVAKIAKKVKA